MAKNNRYNKELIQVLARVSRDKRLLHAFLEDLLTPSEYEEIINRWQIVKQLDKGVPQREIAKNLGVSIATITRGSRELADEQGGFKKVLKRLYKK